MSTTTTHKASKKSHKKARDGSVSILSAGWNVTNNAGLDLVVIDAFQNDPTSASQLYQSPLRLLSTTDGKQALKAGETKAITLSEPHTDADGNVVDYTIVIARADNLFPVKIVDLSSGAESYDDCIVTTSNVQQLKLAEQFVQTIMAFPSSQLASDFAEAITDGDDAVIAAFFSSNKPYTSINLEAVVAVQSYYNQYAFVWAGYNSTQSYSLYTTDGISTKKNLGTVTFDNSTVAPLTNLDAPVGFTVTYMDANHRKTVLHYANGQFSEDVNSTTPKICLQGLFLLRSGLTGNEADNQLMPVLYGVVNGAQTFGYTDGTPKLMAAAVSIPSSIKDFFTPQSLGGWLKLCGAIVGALALIAGFGVAIYIYKRRSAARTLAELQQRTRETLIKNLDRMKAAGIEVPTDLNKALNDIKAEANLNLLTDNKAKLTDSLNRQLAMTEKLLKYGNSPEVQKTDLAIENDLRFGPGKLEPADLANRIDYYNGRIKANADVIERRLENLGDKVSAQDHLLISNEKEAVSWNRDIVDTNEKIREDLLEDRLPEIIEA